MQGSEPPTLRLPDPGVRLSTAQLEDYLSGVAGLLERYGVVLDLEPTAPVVLEESPSGSMSFELRGFLPDGLTPPLSILEVRERWQRLSPVQLERSEYEFVLLDQERGFRRAFHLHDSADFIRRFHVVVHEHCERPLGIAPCAHVAGSPVRDGYRGVELLLEAWIAPNAPDCNALPCLETDALNRVVADVGDTVDPFVAEGAARILKNVEW